MSNVCEWRPCSQIVVTGMKAIALLTHEDSYCWQWRTPDGDDASLGPIRVRINWSPSSPAKFYKCVLRLHRSHTQTLSSHVRRPEWPELTNIVDTVCPGDKLPILLYWPIVSPLSSQASGTLCSHMSRNHSGLWGYLQLCPLCHWENKTCRQLAIT